jgi:ribosomal protein S18 acetylase RimI-like enzyme
MSVSIVVPTAADIAALLPALARLLQDAVGAGAALGFLPPLPAEEVTAYWLSVAHDVEAGHRVLLVACPTAAPGEVLGSVQLDLATKTNGLHRAEVAKMMVHTRARRQGLARQLLLALEAQARQHQRTTLVLDTRVGDVAEQLYQSLHYQRAGEIPEYARSADGQLHATAIYYKLLALSSDFK